MSWIAELFMLECSAYFAEHPLEYDAIYIFDRYAYSNVIHQFAKLTDYLETPDAVAAMYALKHRWKLLKSQLLVLRNTMAS